MSDRFTLHHGDCLEVLAAISDCSIDSVVCDPPYGLSFMGRKWDYDVPSEAIWRECLRVLKPGGHLLAFAGTRTQHRMCVRIEDAGFEIRDMIAWVYGSGFPKSLDVSKAIDKAAGAERKVIGQAAGMGKQNPEWNGTAKGRSENYYKPVFDITAPATETAKQWAGWGTAMKPAMEPITVARKPLIGTVAENVLQHGTGAINVDGCRIPLNGDYKCGANGRPSQTGLGDNYDAEKANQHSEVGRWPANFIHDGSDEVLQCFPDAPGQMAAISGTAPSPKTSNVYGRMNRENEASENSDNKGAVGFKMKPGMRRLDAGSAARFFYCAKASKKDRNEGCEELDKKISARSCQAQAEAKRGNVVECEGGAFNKARIVQNNHPTVKPTDLMRYLCRLVTPPGGLILDPFMGSGSTGKAAILEGFRFIGIEREAEYLEIAQARIAHAVGKTNNMLAFE